MAKKSKKLIWHIIPSFLLIMFISVATLCIYTSIIYKRLYRDHIIEDLKARATLLQLSLSSVQFDKSREHTGEIDTLCKEIGGRIATRLTVILPDGTVIGDSNEDPAQMDNHGQRPEIIAAYRGRVGISTRYSATLKQEYTYVAVPLMRNGQVAAVIRTSVPFEMIGQHLNKMYFKIVIMGLIVILCTSIISFALADRISKPIKEITEKASRFAERNYDFKLEVPLSEELDSLVKVLNSMSDQLHERIDTVTDQKNKLNEYSDTLKNLNKIGIALSAEHNLNSLLDMIVRETRQFTRSDGGSLYIKKGDELSFEVAQNETIRQKYGDIPFKSFKIPISKKSIAGYVALTGEIINIPNLDAVGDEVPFSLETMRDFDRKNGYKTVSMLVVPMRDHKDEIIGVIQLLNSLDEEGKPHPYDKNIENLVISLASQAAVAIRNSILIQNIKDLFESLVAYSAEAIDARSPHTAGHSERVSKLAVLQVLTINQMTEGPFASVHFNQDELNELRIAALLHDIGKIGVREWVLDKVNKLSDDKMEAIKNRFFFIRKFLENQALIRKFVLVKDGKDSDAEFNAIDEETETALNELISDFELIQKLNIPKFAPDEDFERLKRIAGKTYIETNGTEQPYLKPKELESLSVQKGNLTPGERMEIESHVRYTMNIIDKIPFTDEYQHIPEYAAAHHEMLDGSGYPDGIKADDIPLQSRIISVADIYDALTAKDRPYKPPLPLDLALKIMREEADKGRLDKDLVELFINEKIYSLI